MWQLKRLEAFAKMHQAVDDSSLGCIKDELPAESEDELPADRNHSKCKQIDQSAWLASWISAWFHPFKYTFLLLMEEILHDLACTKPCK